MNCRNLLDFLFLFCSGLDVQYFFWVSFCWSLFRIFLLTFCSVALSTRKTFLNKLLLFFILDVQACKFLLRSDLDAQDFFLTDPVCSFVLSGCCVLVLKFHNFFSKISSALYSQFSGIFSALLHSGLNGKNLPDFSFSSCCVLVSTHTHFSR